VFKHRAENRVVKRLGDFEIVVAFNQLAIAALGCLPELQVVELVAGNQLDKTNNLFDFFLVEVDAFDGGFADAIPVTAFKTRPRRQGDVLVIREIGFETIQDGAGETLVL